MLSQMKADVWSVVRFHPKALFVLYVQPLDLQARKLDFPIDSPLSADAAHHEDVQMHLFFSVQHITPEQSKSEKQA